ncbi:MAG: hypothetical protein A2504_15910 [Bdellovibrionales bacterium RIFOXYD12_FULL_39_22]|nr:MAG: hypothetical protein A2385_07820 [Bdellovibrionales bacterium RIFOXYB1_FULL_39_21]OFZ43033.1 MAG: hypothetical protein A2485_11405 [Bdellovibrionales bacterium RIFOXYC12_FULL_39_17]OFZ50881.1 MAG: hypothetical protein A2404_06735 [Bdellovibrionales bacterium RIFOXYC1_FULL_39_130]OFZ78104.1 MAG: hypothetical protein A2560_01905 [Bdellovibrionales bacterium RIFOXYD1_FULL_39_84]OFZ93972.1 MAG: hypothetical protein A2504_15910 [Bdellovibrionales bacterium RIFOXYD12_FULL_39_22]HLE10421.1 hy
MVKTNKSLEAKQKILAGLIRLAYKEGIDSVTYQKVADEVGLSYYLVHYYFAKGTNTLLDEGIAYVGKRAQEYISNYISNVAKESNVVMIHQYILGTLNWGRDFPDESSFWAYYYHLCSRRSDMAKFNQEVTRVAQKRVERLIREDIGSEHFPFQNNIPELAEDLHTYIVGATIKYLTNRNDQQFDHVVKQSWRFAEKLFTLHARKFV